MHEPVMSVSLPVQRGQQSSSSPAAVLVGVLSTLPVLWSSSPGQLRASSGWTSLSSYHSLMMSQLATPSRMRGILGVSILVSS